ncbi:Death-associated inhibitor of apoptosis 2 [Nymphon striatum]|nr:Death-associated inhibitor of apoptosis 2 [Nymphon striatum]
MYPLVVRTINPRNMDVCRFKSEKLRLDSYAFGWSCSIPPLKMAQAGFYYIFSQDKVQCAFCNGIIGNWNDKDDPLTEHKRHFPSCPFVLKTNLKNDCEKSTGVDICSKYVTTNTLNMGTRADPFQLPTSRHPKYASLSSRLNSFNTWPITNNMSGYSLAKAGFFYKDITDKVSANNFSDRTVQNTSEVLDYALNMTDFFDSDITVRMADAAYILEFDEINNGATLESLEPQYMDTLRRIYPEANGVFKVEVKKNTTKDESSSPAKWQKTSSEGSLTDSQTEDDPEDTLSYVEEASEGSLSEVEEDSEDFLSEAEEDFEDSLPEVEDASIMAPPTHFMTSLEGRGYTIIEKASRYIKTFAYTEKNYGLVFTDEWPHDNFSQAIDALYELFDRVIKRATENMHPEHTMRICIEHQALRTPIVAPLMPVKQMNVDIIINSVEKVLQSNTSITFDDTLKLPSPWLTCLKDQNNSFYFPVPKGGARLHMTDLEFGGSVRLKKSLIEITAKDNMCLARALVIGFADLKDKSLYEKLRRDNSRLQRVKAIELLNSLNLDISKKQDILSIPKFEQYLNIQIIVISGIKNPVKKKKVSMCDSFWKCSLCTVILDVKICNRTQHVCGNYKCPNCKEYAGVDHLCYIPFTKKPDESENYIFFDFECTQDTGIHIPNYCVALKVCSRCINNFGICSSCGDHSNKKSSYYIFDYGHDTKTRFCRWLFAKHNARYTVIAHNSKAYDSFFCLDYLLSNAIKPKIIFSGSKIMYLHVQKDLNIRLIDSINFINMPLKKLPKCFGIKDLKKGDFPHLFNTIQNADYVGKYPDISFYGIDRLKTDERVDFLKWYDGVKNDVFNFKAEMLAYCKTDVTILAKSCISFRNMYIKAGGLDPFRYTTVSAACMGAYKSKFCQELFNIDGKEVQVTGRVFPSGHKNKTFIKSYFPYISHHKDTFSIASIAWLEYRAHKYNIKIRHALNDGEYVIPGRKYRLDGYDELTKTAYEFHSCFFHGCVKCQTDRSRMIGQTNKTVQELYNLTMYKKKYLLENGYNYICIWYHEYELLLKNDSVFKNFVDNLDITTRLDPREGLFGGRTNAIKLYYKPQKNEKISYLDFTSLYPYINKTKKYMISPPIIITRNFGDISTYFGFVKCKILPPKKLFHPLLPHRVNNKLLFALCNACAQTGVTRVCKCSDKARSFTGTWTTVEIEKALELNYKIVKIYEVWHYDETLTYSDTTPGLFSDYINCFLKYKEESSGYPDSCNTDQEKESYRQQYFQREGVVLENMVRNPGLRSVSKVFLNSLWGKFGQRSDLTQVEYCTNGVEFFRHMADPGKIVTDFKVINEDLAMIIYKKPKEDQTIPLFSNVPIAAMTTSYARLHLYSIIEQLATSRQAPRPSVGHANNPEEGAAGGATPGIGNDLQRSVSSLIDAVRDLLSNLHLPEIPRDGDGDDEDSDDEREE